MQSPHQESNVADALQLYFHDTLLDANEDTGNATQTTDRPTALPTFTEEPYQYFCAVSVGIRRWYRLLRAVSEQHEAKLRTWRPSSL